MTISDRFRQLTEIAAAEADRLGDSLPASLSKALRAFDSGVEELQDVQEQVGEIPQFRLEAQLSPVLLRVHGHLDRARVMIDDGGYAAEAAAVWELEQQTYRLLNDL